MFYTWSEVVLDIYLGIKITLKVSLNSYLSPKNCGPSVRILTPGSIIPLHCFLKKKRFGKRPYFLWGFFRQKDPSYAIFSKSREFKDIKYDAYNNKYNDQDKDDDKDKDKSAEKAQHMLYF